MRHRPRTVELGFLALLALLVSATCRAALPSKPDMLIFLTDDHSQLDLSPYGGREFRTPNMQRLADAGMTFTGAYVASPSCAPSRAALLTALMPARNGAEPNHAKPRAEIKKWPAYFQELGYEVVAFGKVSHYGHTIDYGFDYFAHDKFHDHASIPAAVEWLKKRGRNPNKPLCIFVGSNWPHVPWPEKDLGYDPSNLRLPDGTVDTPETREWRARYAAAVTKADNDLGQVLDAAYAALGTNILVLFSADHGAQWPFAKWNCYESGVRVPLMVSWPGVIKPGSRTSALVNWTDFLPTLLEVAGGKPPRDLNGRSFLRVFTRPNREHRDRIFTTHSGDGRFNVYPMRALRQGDWKYIRNLHPEYAFTTHIDLPVNLGQRAYFATWEAAAKTNARAAEIVKRYHQRPAEELYYLAEDPTEQHNLAGDPKFASRLNTMRSALDGWMREQGDQQKTFAEPRLLSDRSSYGPGAAAAENLPARKGNKKKGAEKANDKVGTKAERQSSGGAMNLPSAQMTGGKPLMQALAERHTSRELSARPIPHQVLGNLLWAAFGINRPESGHRTAPSAMNSQEVDIYVATTNGVCVYRPEKHQLDPVRAGDLRPTISSQAFVKNAPAVLVYVATLPRLANARPESRPFYAAVDTGCIVQNVYLLCASEGLGTVVFDLDRKRLAEALGLTEEQEITLAQAVGYPAGKE